MFDISDENQRNTYFIHHVLFVDFNREADTAKEDPTLPVFFEEIILENKDIRYIQKFNRQNNTSFSEKAYFVKWIGKMEHAFDVQDGKLEENKQILVFWQHRGRNQQFCVDEDQQTLHPLGKFELAWGCRDEALKLVLRGDPDVIKFSNLSENLKKKRKLGEGRMREIADMSRATTEWDSPMVTAYGIFGSITETALALK